MKYKSTRGGITGITFEEALLSGYAPDGGLYVPENIPEISHEDLSAMKNNSYKEILFKVISLFISTEEIPGQDLENLVESSFYRFKTEDVIQWSTFEEGLKVMELFHGPTMAFKDLALSLVGQLLEYFLKRKNKHITIVVGTSGDTGSAAIQSVKGLSFVDIIVLYPKDRCSTVQELQMTTVNEDNVHVFRVEGTSDDLDAPIKRCFIDIDFIENHALCGINSINWARILFQVAHYFYAYNCQSGADSVIEVAIPTGACGNCTGGVVAQEMGLPVKLVCCVNVNDIVHRTLESGDFSVQKEVTASLSSAMDIQVPYNIERLIYFKSGCNSKLTSKLMTEFETKGHLLLPEDILAKMKTAMESHRVTDEDILTTIKWCWDEFEYLICPHTATAVHYHREKTNGSDKKKHGPLVCVATASYSKFPEVYTSLGMKTKSPSEVEELMKLQPKYIDINKNDDWDLILRKKIESITNKHTTKIA